MVTTGRAVAHIEGVAHDVTVGDTSFIPAGVRHYFENASSTEEMHIFWTYSSVDATTHHRRHRRHDANRRGARNGTAGLKFKCFYSALSGLLRLRFAA